MSTQKQYKKIVHELINSDFKQIVTANTMHKKQKEELADFKQIWIKSGELNPSDAIDTEADWRKVKSRINFYGNAKRLKPGKYFLRIAAIFILALGLSVGLKQLVHYYQQNTSDFITASSTDNSKEIILPDASVVILNRQSTLSYNADFGQSNRDIILNGEAHFNVKKNKAIPFRVYTGLSTVEVLGTIFNIRENEGKIKVAVTEGLVKLYETENKANKLEIAKDESAEFVEEDASIHKVVIDLTALQWLPNRLDFYNTPINEVLTMLAKRHHMEYSPRAEFDSITYTGNLSNKKLDEIATLINLSLSNKEKQLVISEEQIRLTTMN